MQADFWSCVHGRTASIFSRYPLSGRGRSLHRLAPRIPPPRPHHPPGGPARRPRSCPDARGHGLQASGPKADPLRAASRGRSPPQPCAQLPAWEPAMTRFLPSDFPAWTVVPFRFISPGQGVGKVEISKIRHISTYFWPRMEKGTFRSYLWQGFLRHSHLTRRTCGV